jgi:hypothetical protein
VSPHPFSRMLNRQTTTDSPLCEFILETKWTKSLKERRRRRA